jgi:hypothetical protein
MHARKPLIDALSRAFPSWEDRNNLARAAQIRDPQLTGDAAQVWEGLLDEAEAQGRTEALGNAVAAAGRPKLADAIRRGGLDAERPRAVVLGAALMASALFLFLFYVALDPAGESPGVQVESTASRTLREGSAHEHENWPGGEVLDHVRAERPGREEPVVADPEGEPAVEPVVEADPAAAAEGSPPTEDPEHASTEEAERATPAAVPATPSAEQTGWGKCLGRPGERIGYAWAGDTAPGEPWHIEAPVNVRIDYPRAENDWNTSSATVCILPSGVDLALPEGTIAVAGGAVYVPVIAPGAP